MRKDVGARLREERLGLGFNQTDFAKIGAASKRSQVDWEKGASSPNADYLEAIAAAGADVLYILTGKREAGPLKDTEAQDNHLLRAQIEIATAFDDFWRELDMRREAALPLFVARYNGGEIKQVPGIDQISESDVYQWLHIHQKPESMKPVLDTDFVTVPLYDVAASCGGGSIIHSEQIVDHLAFRAEWVRNELGADPKRLALIAAIGDSMLPAITSGDLLLIDASVCVVRQDAIYAIQVEGVLLVKRIQRLLDGTIIVKSDNPAYESQRFSPGEAKGLRIVGRVIWMGRRV